jgi:hypothetical protein
MFDYIEIFYNPNHKHTNDVMLSLFDYEIKQREMGDAGVWDCMGAQVENASIEAGGNRGRSYSAGRTAAAAHGPRFLRDWQAPVSESS